MSLRCQRQNGQCVLRRCHIFHHFLESVGFINGFVNRYGDTVDAEFDSRWEYPEKAINELIALLAAKDKIYIRILTYELEDEYVSFRIFSQGKWNIKLS